MTASFTGLPATIDMDPAAIDVDSPVPGRRALTTVEVEESDYVISTGFTVSFR